MFSSIFTNSKHTESSGSKVFDDKLCASKGGEVSKRFQTKPATAARPGTHHNDIGSMFKSTK